MWNKRREDEPAKSVTPQASAQTPPPVAVAPRPVQTPKEAPAVSTMPVGKFDPEGRSGSAAIGKAVKINGQINSKEDLFVDGDVEGTLEAPDHRVTIGPNGKVHATVKAREVIALGNIQGNVEATDKIEIRKEARLIGDIRTARIVIEDGAYFKGSIDIVKSEAKVASKPQVVSTPATPVTPATSHAAVGAGTEVKR